MLTKMENEFERYDDKRLIEETFRLTGRTTRQVDELVQEFFNKPMGTMIHVCDHYGYKLDNYQLLDRFAKRMSSEHPSASYKIHKGEQIMIERTYKTYHDRVMEEYQRRKERC